MSRKMMSSILDFIIECFETITVMKSDALKKTVQQIPPIASKNEIAVYLAKWGGMSIFHTMVQLDCSSLKDLKQYCMQPNVSKLTTITAIKHHLQRTQIAYTVVDKYVQLGRIIYYRRLATKTNVGVIAIVGKVALMDELLSGQLTYTGCEVAAMHVTEDDAVVKTKPDHDTIHIYGFANTMIVRYPMSVYASRIKQNRYAVHNTLDVIFEEAFQMLEQFFDSVIEYRYGTRVRLGVAQLVGFFIHHLTLLDEHVYLKIWGTDEETERLRIREVIDIYYRRIKKEGKVYDGFCEEIMKSMNDRVFTTHLLAFINGYLSHITIRQIESLDDMIANSSYVSSNQMPSSLSGLVVQFYTRRKYVQENINLYHLEPIEELCFIKNEDVLSQSVPEIKAIFQSIYSYIVPFKQWITTGNIIYEWKKLGGNHGSVALTLNIPVQILSNLGYSTKITS
eukprot:298769_1